MTRRSAVPRTRSYPSYPSYLSYLSYPTKGAPVTDTTPPKDLIGMLDYYLVRKAPFQLPDAAREAIVRFGPWIAVVILVITLPAILVLLGIGTALLPFGGYAYATAFTYAVIFLIIHFVLLIASLPGLFARRMSGWRLAFYAELFNILWSLSNLNIVGGLLFGLIGLYILFQIRGLYH